jgi:hypothetical protein
VLALAALSGTALRHLGEPSTASPAAWAAAGAALRALHNAPPPPWPGRGVDALASHLAGECEWLVANDVLPAEVVTRNRRLAETALWPWTPRVADRHATERLNDERFQLAAGHAFPCGGQLRHLDPPARSGDEAVARGGYSPTNLR